MSDSIFKNIGDQLGRFIADQSAREDIQKSMNLVAQNAFSKLDLVTREQFDAQLEALEQAQARIASLEQQIDQLTEQLERLEAIADPR